jgi:hypothetical protein
MKKIDDTLRNIGIAPKSPLNDQELSTYLSIVEPTLTNLKQALYTDLMELISNIYTFEPFDDEEQLRNILEAKIKDYLGIEDEV